MTGDETVALAAALAAYGLSACVLGLASEECVDTLSSMHRRLTEADRPGGYALYGGAMQSESVGLRPTI